MFDKIRDYFLWRARTESRIDNISDYIKKGPIYNPDRRTSNSYGDWVVNIFGVSNEITGNEAIDLICNHLGIEIKLTADMPRAIVAKKKEKRVKKV